LFGEIVSERYDQAVLLRALGEEWHLMQNYFKLHSCCRYNHGTLDALDILAERGTLPAAADISSIEVTTYKYAAELTDPAPRNTLGAKFSVPFAVATRIVNGSSGLSSFTWDAIRNPDVLALASKVSVIEDPSMTARLPQERPARVRLVDTNGHAHEAEVGVNRGDDTSPYTTQELSNKFLDLCERVWSRSHANALLNSTLSLGDAKSGDTASFQKWLEMLRRVADR
jgi:2-methylcitrate dehydratase PrpD